MSERLAARVGELLGPRHPVFAAATVTAECETVAARGADLGADFEIGSVSKGVTGLLYADALARGEIRHDTTLGQVLPLGDAPAGGLTLAAISTHRSGLPVIPWSAHQLRRVLAWSTRGANPYGESLEELLTQARAVRLGKPRARYSNLGFELLGHAVAAAAGMTYAELVRERLAEPLGLEGLYTPSSADELRPSALPGRSRRGRPREPWTGEAVGPAGGIRAGIRDVARLVAALLDGSAPGLAALDPVAPFSKGTRIGAAWIVSEAGGRDITWHNGGTGGFRSWVGLDRAAGAGVVILSATDLSVDRPGFALLAEGTVTSTTRS